MVDVGTLGGTSSGAWGVNAAGRVVADSDKRGGAYRALSWTQTGGMVDLGTLGGTYSGAWGINASGQVVGESNTTEGAYHAFSWTQAGGMVDLNLHIPTAPAGMELYIGLALSDNG